MYKSLTSEILNTLNEKKREEIEAVPRPTDKKREDIHNVARPTDDRDGEVPIRQQEIQKKIVEDSLEETSKVSKDKRDKITTIGPDKDFPGHSMVNPRTGQIGTEHKNPDNAKRDYRRWLKSTSTKQQHYFLPRKFDKSGLREVTLEPKDREAGTKSLVKTYIDDTPGQQLDEISKKKMWIYAMDAKKQVDDLESKSGTDHHGYPKYNFSKKEKQTYEKRAKGLNYVAHKLTDVPKDSKSFGKSVKEEAEQLDEISKKTLSNYYEKARQQASKFYNDKGESLKQGYYDGESERKFRNRQKGKGNALDRYTGKFFSKGRYKKYTAEEQEIEPKSIGKSKKKTQVVTEPTVPSSGYTPMKEDCKKEDCKIGDKVHLGFGAKGGAGFIGKIIKDDGETVHIKHESGKVYKGPHKFVSKMNEQQEKSDLAIAKHHNKNYPQKMPSLKRLRIADKRAKKKLGIKEETEVLDKDLFTEEEINRLDEISKNTIKNYVSKASQERSTLKAGVGYAVLSGDNPERPGLKKYIKKLGNRSVGIHKALKRWNGGMDTKEGPKKYNAEETQSFVPSSGYTTMKEEEEYHVVAADRLRAQTYLTKNKVNHEWGNSTKYPSRYLLSINHPNKEAKEHAKKLKEKGVRMIPEDRIDEISKKTLGSYISKAAFNSVFEKNPKKKVKRALGMMRASDRLDGTKSDYENSDKKKLKKEETQLDVIDISVLPIEYSCEYDVSEIYNADK